MKIQRLSLIVYCLAFYLMPAYGQTASFTIPNGNLCSGSAVIFTNTSTGASSYFWEFGDGSTSKEMNPSHIFNASPGNGTQQFIVTLTARQGNARNSATQAIMINQPPDPTLTDPTNWPAFSMCSGGTTLNLTVNNSSTTTNTNYQIAWGDGGGSFSSSTFTSQNHTYIGAGAYDMVFTVTGANGCVIAKTYQVFIGGNPSLVIGSPGGTTGCAPLTLSFDINASGNLGTTYSFTFNDGSDPEEYTQTNLPPSITHTFNERSCSVGAPTNDFYELVAIATNSCGFIQYKISPIRIDREPFAQIAVDPDTVCLGNLVTYNNATIPPCGGNPALTNYTWVIDGATTNITSTASQTKTYLTAGQKTVTLTASNSTILSCNGGQSTASIDVLVVDSAIPAAPDAPSGPTQVCQGEQGVIFTVPAVIGATQYTWNLPTGATIFSGQGTNTIIVNFAPDATPGLASLTVSGGNACQSGSASVPYSFTINPMPTMGEIDGVPSLCQGQAEELTYTVIGITNADEYIWTIPAGTTIVSGEGTTSITVSFPIDAASGNVSVFGKNDCGNGSPASLYVEVKPIPSAASGMTGPSKACEGEEVTISVNGITNADLYLWTMEDGSVATTTQTTITKAITGGGSIATFEVYGANPCGIGTTAFYSFPVYPAPKPNFAPADHCHGSPTPLIDTSFVVSDTIISWDWDFGDGYKSNLEEPEHIYADSGSYTITLAVQSNKGCNSLFDSTIIVNPTPDAHHRPIPIRTSLIKPEITFRDSSFFARTWYWDFGDSTNATVRNPIHAYTKTGKFKVMEVAYFGLCTDTTYSTVTIYEGIFVPSAFMPGRVGGGGGGGGSGGGDDTGRFKPLFGVAAQSNGYSFTVFNRWGEMIFSTSNPDDAGWNGLVRNTGKSAPVGVYAWRITYKEIGTGKVKTRTGNVMLLR